MTPVQLRFHACVQLHFRRAFIAASVVFAPPRLTVTIELSVLAVVRRIRSQLRASLVPAIGTYWPCEVGRTHVHPDIVARNASTSTDRLMVSVVMDQAKRSLEVKN